MFQGSMVALVTPMTTSGEIDANALRELVEWHVAEGTDAIVAVGTTGESATLDEKEHIEVIEIVVKQAKNRIPVIAGTGANSTQEALTLTEAAQEKGADATLSVTPYYNKPTQEGLYQHFKVIAERCPLPLILYNVPGRTAVDMSPETVERLTAIANVVGIKEATGNMERCQEILSRCGDRLDIYSGDDASALALMLMGGKGVISVTANIAPKAMHEMCALALEGDFIKARSINRQLFPLHRDLFLEPNPIPVKWALHEMGKLSEGIRLPLTPLRESLRSQLRRSLVDANLVSQ